MIDLKQIVKDRIGQLGVKEASKFYGVSVGTVSNWASGKTPPSVDAVTLTLKDLDIPATPEVKDLVMWEGRQVALLMPVYRTLNPDTHFTLFANYMKYGPEKIAMPRPLKGTCIWEARNRLIDKGMNIPGVKKFIMPDDDMAFPFGYPDHFNQYYESNLPAERVGHNAISRIMSHPSDKGIIGAMYFGRHSKGRSQCEFGFLNSLHEDERLRNGYYKGLVPMGWVGTGFIRIERWVIEAMRKEIDNGRWPECKPAAADKWYGYFNPLRVGIGEDVSFCRRAAEIGIQSYLDSSLECLHFGERAYASHNTKP